MKKQISILIALLATSCVLFAQQEPQFSHYFFNQQYYNPAYVGSRDAGSFTALHRSQWLGFEGAPVTQVVSFQTPIFKSKAGVGASASRHQAGFGYSYLVSAAYSYNIRLTQYWSLRLGLQGTLEFVGYNFNDPDVVTVTNNDPALNEESYASRYIANAGAGMYLTYKDLFYLGASSPQVYPNQIGFDDQTRKTAQAYPHRYLNMGAALPVSDQWELMPNVMFKYVEGAPLDAELSFSMRYLERLLAGINYRVGGNKSGESIDLLFYFQFNQKIGAGLAYDITLSDIRSYESGSLEFVLRYDLRDERADLENPRFFKKD